MKKIKIFAGLGIVGFLPALALAQGLVVFDLKGVINAILSIMNAYLLPLLLAIAVFVIIFGAFQFVTGAGDEEKRKIGKDKILWGIVGVVVMLVVWGLINIVLATFSFDPIMPSAPPVGLP